MRFYCIYGWRICRSTHDTYLGRCGSYRTTKILLHLIENNGKISFNIFYCEHVLQQIVFHHFLQASFRYLCLEFTFGYHWYWPFFLNKCHNQSRRSIIVCFLFLSAKAGLNLPPFEISCSWPPFLRIQAQYRRLTSPLTSLSLTNLGLAGKGSACLSYSFWGG